MSRVGTMNTKWKYYALCLTYVRTDRQKRSFLFSSSKWWNSLPLEIRTSSSLCIFKHSLLKYLQVPSRNYLFLWLEYVQRQYLTPASDLTLVPWNATFFRRIDVHHQLVLFAIHCCLSFATLRDKLFAFAAHIRK